MFDDLYSRLGRKEKRYIYDIGQARERKTKDINHVKCTKHEGGRVLTQDKEILYK